MRSLLPILVTSLLLLLAAIAGAQEDPLQISSLASGSITPIGDPPAPGEAVRIRLRDTALDHVLENPSGWSLRSGDQEIPSLLRISEGRAGTEWTELAIVDPGRPESNDRLVILDRGDPPLPLDRIRFSFSATEVLTSVLPEAGPTRADFSQTGREQVVMQQVGSEGVLRVTELEFSPLDLNRYIRLTIRKGGGLAVSEASGRLAGEQPEVHEVPVAIGAMRALPAAGGSMWPLVLSSNHLPLRKLKIIAEAPDMYRRVRFVRIDDKQHEIGSEAEMVFADGLQVNGLKRSSVYLELPPGGSGQQPALVVEDGSGNALPIRSLQAYAAEAWICFVWPEGAAPVLSGMPAELATVPTLDDAGRLAGTFSSVLLPDTEALVAERPDQASRTNSSKGLLAELELDRYIPQFTFDGAWFIPLGLALVAIGFVLLLTARLRDIRR
ncbi:hypothetical protein KDL44_14160 [bacterium]|nr:hypothetical protein [bacterium]